jgi:hypothetical protein
MILMAGTRLTRYAIRSARMPDARRTALGKPSYCRPEATARRSVTTITMKSWCSL